jgi:hypothetical protein
LEREGGRRADARIRTADPFITSAVSPREEAKGRRADARIRTADPFITSAASPWKERGGRRADARIRTADPFITSEVLYQLSYVGGGPLILAAVPVRATTDARLPNRPDPSAAVLDIDP